MKRGRSFLIVLLALLVGAGVWWYLDAVPRVGADTRPRSPMVVAARDLGAGTVLDPAADLVVTQVPTDEISPGAVADPEELSDQALRVVRFQGEVVTRDMMGTRITLAAHEKAIAVPLTDVAGLAGLVEPGQEVGLMAVVIDEQSNTKDVVVKYLMDGLKVIWLSPDFRVRPGAEPGAERRGSDQGLALLAVSTHPAPILYARQSDLYARALDLLTDEQKVQEGITPEFIDSLRRSPDVIWSIPFEILTAVSATGTAFRLVLEPEDAVRTITPGASTFHLMRPVFTLLEEEDMVIVGEREAEAGESNP